MAQTSSARTRCARTVVAAFAPTALACTLLGGAFVGLGTLPRTAGAQTARDDSDAMDRPEVRRVRFLGVHALDEDDVADAVKTHASGCTSIIFTPFCLVTKSPLFYERRYLDRGEFARDVVRLLVFYYKRGWRDTQVDTTVRRVGRNAVDVTFAVREGQPTRVVQVALDDSLGPLPRRTGRFGRTVAQGANRGLLGLRAGDPLNLLVLDSGVTRVRNVYWNRGYGNAVIARPVVTVNDTQNVGSVRVPVHRGPLTPIARIDILHLDDQHNVSDRTIRNSLSIDPGDLFRVRQIARSQRALYESGLFRTALIDTAVATDAASGSTVCASQSSLPPRPLNEAAATKPDSAKSLVVCVAEAPLHEARVAVGFTTADFLQVQGRFTSNAFIGGARRLTVSAVVGNLGARQLYRALPASLNNAYKNDDILGATQSRYFLPTYQAGIDFTQRWFGSPRNTVGGGLFVHRRLSPGVFVDQGQGANATFTRLLTDGVPASLTYNFEVSRVQAGDVYFCVNYGVCDRRTVAALQRQQKISPLALTVSLNRANDPLEPTRGYTGQFTGEHASALTASDFRYNRVSGDLANYRPAPVFHRVTIAAHLRAGYVASIGSTSSALGVGGTPSVGGVVGGDILHPRVRFYAGGARSVRGYGENQLGPRVLTIDPNKLLGRRDTTIGGQTVLAGYDCPDAQAGGITAATLRSCFLQRRNQIGDGAFTARPLGGSALLEGSVEARFPVWKQLLGAVFVDAGVLGENSLRNLTSGTRAVTPGFGIRYRSPVGPVRVDLGIRPMLRETLPVITQRVDSTGQNVLFDLTSGQRCDAGGAPGCRQYPNDQYTGIQKIARRIVLHLSIGEAF